MSFSFPLYAPIQIGLFGGACLCAMTVSAVAQVQTCGADYFPGTTSEHEVGSVPVISLKKFLNTNPSTEGMKFDIEQKGSELWIDPFQAPPTISALIAVRTLFIVGRVTQPTYKTLVLADEGQGIFQIPYSSMHKIGCQFVWGVEGRGQNPIALTREFVDALQRYPDGLRVAPEFNGSLLGDTNRALTTMTSVVYPQWLFKHLELK
jgi:hypothetical protein